MKKQKVIKIEEELFIKAKIQCLHLKVSFSNYICNLIKKDLESKKDIR